ncbi:type VI secretion system tip protein VgrG, partial [Pseudomonas aeruginosa]
PWLWLLTRTSDCRIFQNQKVPDIIKQVFRDLGFSDFEDALSRSYREWEYCVQYRETSFDFVSRLMEQEGIYYWFRHEQKRHILVLS